MRIQLVCMLLGFALASCREAPRYLNADELVRAPSDVSPSARCNDVAQQGDDVGLKGSRSPAPTAAGGEIADGTYVLTSTTLHTKDQPNGATLVGMGKVTMRVEGKTSQIVRHTVNGRVRRTTVDRVSSGTTTTLKTTCTFPDPTEPESSTVTYTATSNTVQFITPGPAGTVVATYTKVVGGPDASEVATGP